VVRKINEESYEPPIVEIATDMTHIGFFNQIFVYYIPVSDFSGFGSKILGLGEHCSGFYVFRAKNDLYCLLRVSDSCTDHVLREYHQG
jgi:hypothetical protein